VSVQLDQASTDREVYKVSPSQNFCIVSSQCLHQELRFHLYALLFFPILQILIIRPRLILPLQLILQPLPAQEVKVKVLLEHDSHRRI